MLLESTDFWEYVRQGSGIRDARTDQRGQVDAGRWGREHQGNGLGRGHGVSVRSEIMAAGGNPGECAIVGYAGWPHQWVNNATSEEITVGFLGFGDDAAAAVKDTRSALDQANDGPKDEGVLGNTAHTWISTLLGYGIDGKGPFDSASTVAAEARAKHPDTEAAINALVRKHIALAGAEGFVTSVGGFVTMPVALPVNVFAFYLLATRLTASIASLRGYDLGDPRIRSAVLLAMVGTDADELLSKVGVVAPTGMLTSMVTKQLPHSALMVVNKAVGFRLLTMAGKKTFARFGRNVPFVGGAVGGGLDAFLMDKVADSARREFPLAPTTISKG